MPKIIIALILVIFLAMMVQGWFFYDPWQPIDPSYFEAKDMERKWSYRCFLGRAMVGEMHLSVEKKIQSQRPSYYAHMKIRPLGWLRKISGDRLGIDFVTTVDAISFLPFTFEEITPSKMRQGKAGKKIVYHHDQLFMERKGYEEDIQDDTRDLLSLLLWLRHQEFKEDQLLKSTLNMGRNIYLVIGKVKSVSPFTMGGKETDMIQIHFRAIKMDKGYNPLERWEGNMGLVRGQDTAIPVQMTIRKGFWQVAFLLDCP